MEGEKRIKKMTQNKRNKRKNKKKKRMRKDKEKRKTKSSVFFLRFHFHFCSQLFLSSHFFGLIFFQKVWLGGARTEIQNKNNQVVEDLLKKADQDVPLKMRATVLVDLARYQEYIHNLDEARKILEQVCFCFLLSFSSLQRKILDKFFLFVSFSLFVSFLFPFENEITVG